MNTSEYIKDHIFELRRKIWRHPKFKKVIFHKFTCITTFSCFLFHIVLFRLTISLYSILAVDCGPLSVPINGSSSGDSTVYPNSVLFKCDSGFNLNGSSTRMCQANETWSGLAAVCVGRLQARGQRPYNVRFPSG